MLNLNTMALPLAPKVPAGTLAAPPTIARAAGEVVTVDMLPVAFKAVPPKALISVLVVPVAGSKKLLEPLLPSRYKDPVPKLATSNFGVNGAPATAVPPFVVV